MPAARLSSLAPAPVFMYVGGKVVILINPPGDMTQTPD
jgi:hypothetical protein